MPTDCKRFWKAMFLRRKSALEVAYAQGTALRSAYQGRRWNGCRCIDMLHEDDETTVTKEVDDVT